ncbi:MAG: hypothetical protein WDZ90_00730 [Candidatus Paceibacterota bacterium]
MNNLTIDSWSELIQEIRRSCDEVYLVAAGPGVHFYFALRDKVVVRKWMQNYSGGLVSEELKAGAQKRAEEILLERKQKVA